MTAAQGIPLPDDDDEADDDEPRAVTPRFDVRASVCDASGELDGAYDVIGDDQTIDDILSNLRAVLMRKGDWVTGDPVGDVYIAINIGRSGSGRNLPL